MDLTSLGLNTALIVAIVGLSEFTKRLLEAYIKNKKVVGVLKRSYILIPLIFSIIAAIFMTRAGNDTFLYNVFVYFGVSSLAYGLIKKTFLATDSNMLNSVPVTKKELKEIKEKKNGNG